MGLIRLINVISLHYQNDEAVFPFRTRLSIPLLIWCLPWNKFLYSLKDPINYIWGTCLCIACPYDFCFYQDFVKILENLYAKIFLHNSGCLTIIPSSQFHPRSLFEFLQWRQNTCSVSYGMPHCSHLGSSSRSEIWCPFFFSSFACTSICRCRSFQVVMCLWLSDLLLSMIFSLFNNLYFSRGVVQLELSWSFQ